MRLMLGDDLQIRNVSTGQVSLLQISELWECKGQYVVAGTLSAHSVHVFRGVVPVPARRSCFVFLPNERLERVQAFTQLLDGLPLVARKGLEEFFIVNWSKKLRGSDPLAQFAARVVDAYHHWALQGSLPPWLQERKAPREKDSGNGLWRPG